LADIGVGRHRCGPASVWAGIGVGRRWAIGLADPQETQ